MESPTGGFEFIKLGEIVERQWGSWSVAVHEVAKRLQRELKNNNNKMSWMAKNLLHCRRSEAVSCFTYIT